MYVRGESWLGIGATKPDMRKQGSQSALLARRVADAAKFDARHATTETDVPLANHAAPSYHNILKAGFNVAYVRPNWAEPNDERMPIVSGVRDSVTPVSLARAAHRHGSKTPQRQ